MGSMTDSSARFHFLSLFLSASLHSVRWRHAPVSEDLHLRLLLLAPSLTATTTVAAAFHSRCLFGTAVAVASGSGIVGRLSVGRWASALSTAFSCQGPPSPPPLSLPHQTWRCAIYFLIFSKMIVFADVISGRTVV